MFRNLTKGMLAAVALVTGLSLCGCSGLQGTLPPAPKSSQQTVFELKGALIAAEDGALAIETSLCPATALCINATAVALNKAMLDADTLISLAEIAVRSGSSGESEIAKAQAAVTALQTLVTSSKGTAS